MEADTQVLEALQKLKHAGYTIALDDFRLSDKKLQLLEFADIVKLDMMALDREQLQQHVNELQHRGHTLLAEKVETFDDLEFAKQLGFHLFQGYFLERPQPVQGNRVVERRQSILQLVAELHSSDLEIQDIESIISRDPALSYKLLRLTAC